MKTYVTVLSGSMMLFVIVVVLFAGCCRRQAKPEAGGFTAARVTQYYPVERAKKKITDAGEVAKLMSFFPGLGQRKRRGTVSGWEVSAHVDFVRADGTVLRVSTDFEKWTDRLGKGEWPVEGDLEDYVNTLFAEPQN